MTARRPQSPLPSLPYDAVGSRHRPNDGTVSGGPDNVLPRSSMSASRSVPTQEARLGTVGVTALRPGCYALDRPSQPRYDRRARARHGPSHRCRHRPFRVRPRPAGHAGRLRMELQPGGAPKRGQRHRILVRRAPRSPGGGASRPAAGRRLEFRCGGVRDDAVGLRRGSSHPLRAEADLRPLGVPSGWLAAARAPLPSQRARAADAHSRSPCSMSAPQPVSSCQPWSHQRRSSPMGGVLADRASRTRRSILRASRGVSLVVPRTSRPLSRSGCR